MPKKSKTIQVSVVSILKAIEAAHLEREAEIILILLQGSLMILAVAKVLEKTIRDKKIRENLAKLLIDLESEQK